VLAAGVGERCAVAVAPVVPRTGPPRATVCPQLPTEWGRVTLTDLRLGAITVHFEAEGETVKTLGVPDDWQLLTPAF